MSDWTSDPIREITDEREHARARGDMLVDVCYVVTVAAADRAEARAVTLRDVSDRGIGLLISRTSPKWRQISASGTVALLIHWPTVRRQYRIWGGTVPMDAERLDAYWRRKSHGSMLLEHYYTAFHPQSAPIASRDEFLTGIETLRRQYPDRASVPAPASLAGVYLVPREIEIWHGSEERLHDRRIFRRTGSGWESTTLVP
jgi:pyridoxamine 5'-phosphate oxidase